MGNRRQRGYILTRGRAGAAFLLFLLAVLTNDVRATVRTWTNKVDFTFQNNNGWNPVGAAGGANDLFFTNSLGVSVNININNLLSRIADGFGAQQAIISDSQLGVNGGDATISSNFILRVQGAPADSATFATSSAGHDMFIDSSGQIILAWSNATVSAGNDLTMNSGTMAFLPGQGSAGHTGLVLQVGTAATPNTFMNKGTLTVGIAASTDNRIAVSSNRFVNTGTFVLTNDSSAAGGSLSFIVTGGTGTALTNQATGTMRFVATGSGSGVRNVATVNAGGFVNLGTRSFNQTGGTANN
jgi:hypothetical protein